MSADQAEGNPFLWSSSRVRRAGGAGRAGVPRPRVVRRPAGSADQHERPAARRRRGVGPAQPQSRDLSTSNSQPGAAGSKPCSTSQRTRSGCAATTRRGPRRGRRRRRSPARRSRGLPVPEGQAGEVVQGVAAAGLGPVEDAGDLVAVDEHVGDLEVAVHEHRLRRPERGLGDRGCGDQVRGQHGVREEPRALAVELRGPSSRLRPGHGGSGASCSVRTAAPARPTPPATRSTARRGGRARGRGGRRARARAARATGPPGSGPAPAAIAATSVSARGCRRRRPSGRRRRRGGSPARGGRRRPRPGPRRSSSPKGRDGLHRFRRGTCFLQVAPR